MEDICPFCKGLVTDENDKCPHCGSLIGEGSFETKTIEPGAVLSNRYRIIKELGKGGMGTVYLAEETTMETGRYVAVKLLPPHLTTDSAILARFQEEIKTAARLDHPNIVPIYFVGEHQGLFYFVMKYLEGSTIYQLVNAYGRFSETDTRKYISMICDALYYAHEMGIVHRDMKASNIMISSDGLATLMDFGVARSSETSELTMPGQIVGTAEYMAPEQWFGEAEKRSDIYSMGIIMHYMLTGNLMFKSKNAFELMKMHQEKSPIPIRTVTPDISDEMESIAGWCLQKEIVNRPPDAKVLADCLSGNASPPDQLMKIVVAGKGTADLGKTMTFSMPTDKTAQPVSAQQEKQIARYIESADKAYDAGNIKKALKYAQKASRLGIESTNIDYRLKKFTHLKKTIDEIKKRAEYKLNGGLIREAIKDYETVLQAFHIPEIRNRVEKLIAMQEGLKEKFGEGKKLQIQGKTKEAFKCFAEVVRWDVEHLEAMERKHELSLKLKKKARIKKKRKKKSKPKILKYKTALIVLSVLFVLMIIGLNTLNILNAGAGYFRDAKKYSSPAVFNAYSFYRALDYLEGPNPAREEIIDEMIRELIVKGNTSYRDNQLKSALSFYQQARQMMPDSSVEKEQLDTLIRKISTQLRIR